MIHKNCEKRITLKDICLSKWFMSNYHHIQNPISSKMTSSHPKYKSNYLSDPELISPPGEIQLKKAKTSCFKKISKDVVFSNEDFLDDEGRLPMNIYTMKPKFLFSENPNPESSSFLNYAKGNNPKINEGSMANSCFFLGVNQKKNYYEKIYIINKG